LSYNNVIPARLFLDPETQASLAAETAETAPETLGVETPSRKGQAQLRQVCVPLPPLDTQIDTKNVYRLGEYCREARVLMAKLLTAMDPSNRLDPHDLREDLEEFLKIERQPSADVVNMIRALYGRTEKLLLDTLYSTAARNLVDPADVDAALRAMGASIRPTTGGAKRVMLPAEDANAHG
jgi:hypothetical protein